jgi:uncharacterized integral membrane protein
VAEHKDDSYEFSAVEAKEILTERERGWEAFSQFITWSILATALVLILMLVFIA